MGLCNRWKKKELPLDGYARMASEPHRREIVVTSLADRGPGTLREAINANGPRRITFDVAGDIWLDQHLWIERENCWIDGSTAPDGGVNVRNCTLKVLAPFVYANDVRFMPGEGGVRKYTDGDIDCVTIAGPAHDVTLYHCTLLWGVDENLNTWRGYGEHAQDYPYNITVSDCIIAEGLRDSCHKDGPHSMGALIGYGTKRFYFARNLLASNADRNPKIIEGCTGALINNVIYNPEWVFAEVCKLNPEGADPIVAVDRNVAIPGPDFKGARTEPVCVNRVGDNARIYTYTPDDVWNLTEHNIVKSSGWIFHRMPMPTDAAILPKYQTEKYVLRHAGARWQNRGLHEKRIVAGVKNRTGRIIDHPQG